MQLLTGRPALEKAGIAPHNPLQMLRSQPVFQLIRAVDDEGMKKYLSKDRGNSSKQSDTAATVKKNYNDSLDVGRGLMTSGVKWYKGEPENPPVTDTEEQIRARGYQDAFSFSDSEVRLGTLRVGPGNEKAPKDKTGKYMSDDDYHYHNYFDVSTGQFSADSNDREADSEAAEEEGWNEGTALQKGIRNSEIIWHQIALARSKAPEKGFQNPSKLKSVKRGSISNTQTLDTIFMCEGGDIRLGEGEGTPVVFEEPNDDAMALLGTPNGRSSVVLLLEHGREEGLTDIESVTMTSTSLTIKYM